MPEKIISYIGFAIRARKVKLGVNAAGTAKQGMIKLIVLCHTASENTVKEAISIAKKHHAKIVLSKTYSVEDIVYKQNCKLVAILDKGLAKAISDNLNEHFVILEADI